MSEIDDPSSTNLTQLSHRRANRGRKPTSSEQTLGTNDARGRAYKFYRTCRWDTWLDDFSQARMPNGALRYPTAWSFAKAKDDEQRGWIFAAIGPKLKLKKGQKRAAMPWLGDWQKQRQAGFWLRQDKCDALEHVMSERQSALEVARAVSGFSVSWLRKVHGLAERLNNFFGGQILRPELSRLF